MEADIIFGDTLIYCRQHLKVHGTGWCGVSVRDKVGLGTNDPREAMDKCRDWGLVLYSDLYPNGGAIGKDGKLPAPVEASPAPPPAALVAALRRIAKEPDNVDEWLNADQMQAIARAALAGDASEWGE